MIVGNAEAPVKDCAQGMSAIRAHELTYQYPTGPTALDRVSFEVAEHESVALVGPNGAGKTTLFLCLGGVLPVRFLILWSAGSAKRQSEGANFSQAGR